MRVLITSRGSSGHLLPLVPFGRACADAGHEVLVAVQGQHRANVERIGLPFAEVGDPPPEEWMPLMAESSQLALEAANERMVGVYFAGIDTRAALPALTEIVKRWKPDVIVRETWEFGSTIAGELAGVPVVRVGLGLTSIEEWTINIAAPTLDEIRRDHGLPSDPAGGRLRSSHYFTLIPETIDPAMKRLAPIVHRFRDPSAESVQPFPELWAANQDPLVYLSFGSVAAGSHLPYFPALYETAIEALAELPVRLLVTIGNDRVPEELRIDPLPPNVRVEQWVSQDAISPTAATIVCHGGYGTTMHALGHGTPLVVLPLFSADQWANARAVARVGAGLALDSGRETRRALGLPDPETVAQLRSAVAQVVHEPTFKRAAERVAASIRALPAIDTSPAALAELATRA
jgi:UDP:flavonoid glycosyltransferase YjiC (YdhE family)